MERVNPKIKVFIGWIAMLFQVWFWPWAFSVFVNSGSIAFSLLMTVLGTIVLNIWYLAKVHDQYEWYETLERGRAKLASERNR